MLISEENRRVLQGLFAGIIIGLLIPLILLAVLTGCATDNRPKCTFICPNNNVPVDCYCLEDEINREATKINSNGFHP